MPDGQARLGGASLAVLRQQMDTVASKMEADGKSPDEIKAVLTDIYQHYNPAPPEAPTLGSMATSAARGVGRAILGIPATAIEAAKTVAQNPTNPIGALAGRFILDPAKAELSQAARDVRQGHYLEAAGHGLAAALPVVGPTASHVGTELGTGDPNRIAGVAGEMAGMAATPALTRVAGRAISALKAPLQSAGESMYLRAAKIPETVAKKTNAFRQTGDLSAAESEIAQTLLSRNQGTISRGNVRSLQSDLRNTNKATGRAIDAHAELPDVAPVIEAMDAEIGKMIAEGAPARDMNGAIGRMDEISGMLLNAPSARGLQDFKVGAGRRNASRFASDGPAPGVARIDMAAAGAVKGILEDAVSGVKESNALASRLKPAMLAQAKAVKRAGHHDPIGLTQSVLTGTGATFGALTGGGPGAVIGGSVPLALAAAQRPLPLSFLGQRTYNAGTRVGALGEGITAANKAALLAALLGQQ